MSSTRTPRRDGSRHQGPFCPNRLLAANSKPARAEALAALPDRGEAAGRRRGVPLFCRQVPLSRQEHEASRACLP